MGTTIAAWNTVGALFLLQTLVLILMTNVTINNVDAARLTQISLQQNINRNGRSSSTSRTDPKRTILGLPVSKLVMVADLQHSIVPGKSASSLAHAFRRNISLAHDAQTMGQLNDAFLARGRIVDPGLLTGYYSSFYHLTMDVGTPPVSTSFMLDTGSSLSWVQCAEMAAGFHKEVEGPVYNRTESSSFVAFGCPSPQCSSMAPISQGCNEAGECKYKVGYASGSHTSGILGFEKFTFDGLWLSGIPFGCVQEGAGIDGIPGRGLMGWGSTTFSMPGSLHANIFFCLPMRSFEGAAGAGGGHGAESSRRPTAPASGRGVAGLGDLVLPEGTIFTRLIQSYSGHHMVAMTGISIDGALLPLSFDDFNLRSPELGAVLDTGAYLSYLHPSTYVVVRDAFRKAAQKRGLPQAVIEARNHVDTCYMLDPALHPNGPTRENTPSMDFHFEGDATISLSPRNILFHLVPTHDFYCLSFHKDPNPHLPTLIGNLQLASLMVSINIHKMTVGFTPNSC